MANSLGLTYAWVVGPLVTEKSLTSCCANITLLMLQSMLPFPSKKATPQPENLKTVCLYRAEMAMLGLTEQSRVVPMEVACKHADNVYIYFRLLISCYKSRVIDSSVGFSLIMNIILKLSTIHILKKTKHKEGINLS